MPPKHLLIISLTAFFSFSLSCTGYQKYPVTAASHPNESPGVIEAGEGGSAQTAANGSQEDDNKLNDSEQRILTEALLLRSDGLRLVNEGEFEKALEALDEALNTILTSGLAIEAHPDLQSLFLALSTEAVAVDELLSRSGYEVQEASLFDELKDVTSEEDAGETEEVPEEVTYDLPVVVNNKVKHFIELYQTTRREAIAEGIARSGLYIDRFREILREEGVPTDLVYLAMIESTFKVRAYSRAKAKGIWQFMSWTGKRYGLVINSWIDERSDPEKSCRAAARFLHDLYKELGDWHLAMAAYNGGPGRVKKAVSRMKTRDFWRISSTSRYLRRETRNFVPAILAVAIIMKQPEKYGFGDIVLEKPIRYEQVVIGSPIDLRIAAELAGVTVKQLEELNPAVRRLITPPGYKNFRLNVPVGVKGKLTTKLASLPANKRLKYTEHVVRKGETLSKIAVRYRTSVTALKSANNIRDPRRLKPGQHLIVPMSPTGGGYTSRDARAGVASGTHVTYRVRRGDSLYEIARYYGTTIGSIAAWNRLDSRKPIHPGDTLKIVAFTRVGYSSVQRTASGKRLVHNVRSGDTLYDIANLYKTTVANLKRWNNLRRNLIRPGDRLTVYVGSMVTSSN